MIGPAADPPINGRTLTGGWNYPTSIRSGPGESRSSPGRTGREGVLIRLVSGEIRASEGLEEGIENNIQSARTRYGRFSASQVRISVHSLVSCRSS